jgi:hypothetical protein
MHPVALYEVAVLFGTRVAETILASVHVRAHQQAGHMDASDLIKTLQIALRGGGRSLIASLLSIASCLLRPYQGHGSLRGRRSRRNIWFEAQALQCPQRARMASRGPGPSLAAARTLALVGNHHIRCDARMDPGEGFRQTAAGCSDQRNGSPERHMLCRITESFRASATRALPAPDRLAIA